MTSIKKIFRSFLLIYLLLLEESNSEENDANLILDKLLKEGYTATDLDGKEDFVVLVGGTGSGKSTLSKFLQKDPNLKIEENKAGDLIFTDNEVKIGSGLNSKTLYPNRDVDPETGISIIDCGGFQDTRAPEYDLLAGFLNKKILESAKRLKIIMVEQYSKVQHDNDRIGFRNDLKHVSKLIGANIGSFNNSVGIIATKVDTTKRDPRLIRSIQTFLQDTFQQVVIETKKLNDSSDFSKAEDLNRQQKIIEYLLDGENIGIFRRPDDTGNPWELQPLKKNYQDMRHLIFEKLAFTSPFIGKFRVTVDANTINYINKNVLDFSENLIGDALDEIFDRLLRFFRKRVKINFQPFILKIDTVIEYCQNYVEILSATNSLDQLQSFAKSRGVKQKELITELRFQFSKTQFLYEVSENNVTEIEKKMKDCYERKPLLLKNITYTIDFFTFLKEISADFDLYNVLASLEKVQSDFTNLNINNFKSLPNNLRKLGFSENTSRLASSVNPNENFIKVLQALSTEKTKNEFIFQRNGDSVILSGRFVLLSKIKESIYRNLPLREIIIMGSNKVFIDCDIELQHTHLVIFAPVVEIVEKHRTIHLKGENGIEFQNAKASNAGDYGKHSSRGLYGNPGYSSGNFKIYALDVKNAHLLTVKTEGGNGGNGQHGGDGFREKIYEAELSSDECGEGNFLFYKRITCYDCYFEGVKDCYMSGDYDVIQEMERVPPTNGGDGGDGGAGAFAGTQSYFVRNLSSSHNTKKNIIHGTSGKPGDGGVAGFSSSEVVCTTGLYTCSENDHLSRLIGCDNSEFSDCYPNEAADNGKIGKQSVMLQNYKYQYQSTLIQVLLHFCKNIIKYEHSREIESETKVFLNYLVKFPSKLKVEDLLDLDFGILEKNEGLSRREISNLIYNYSFLYELLNQLQPYCTNCNLAHLKIFELLFFSRLDSLQSFLQGKQVVRLSSSVETLLKRLANVETAIQEVGKFQTVKKEKGALNKMITDAGKLIEEKHKEKMKQIQEKSDIKFEELVEKTVELRKKYRENTAVLKSYRDELKKEMIAKAALGVINIFSTVASAFFPPAAAIGALVTGTASQFVPKVSETGISHLRAEVPQGVQNAKDFIRQLNEKRRRDEILKLTTLGEAMKEVLLEENQAGNFLQNDTRTSIIKLMDDPIFKPGAESSNKVESIKTSNTQLPKIDVTSIVNCATKELDVKIASLQGVEGAQDKIKKFERLKSGLNIGSKVLPLLGNIINEQLQGANKQEEINAAIESNKVALTEMAEFEKNLHDEFQPMVNGMLETFDDFQSEFKNKNTFVLQFQKLDMKNYARKCISMINQFTEGFVKEGDGLASVMTELQEFLTTIIEVYDKIQEMQYRVQLADFVGQLQGGACMATLTSDPSTCNLYRKYSSKIKTNELIREYVYIFSAYQQVLFPYGGRKMNSLNSIISLLTHDSGLTLQEKASNLKAALGTIQNDLDDLNNSIVNDKDKEIAIADFHSEYLTSRPYFVWPQSKYSEQIQSLLKGEQVTFVASVMAPEVKNAVKFNFVMLNFNSSDVKVVAEIDELLKHFELDMIHGGESYYRCGSAYYAIGGEKLDFKMTFERNNEGEYVSRNKVADKLKYGDVPLSPYTVWKFQLIHRSKESKVDLLENLSLLAGKIDLELVGKGFYVADDAEICQTDLGHIYSYYNNEHLNAFS